MRLTRSRNAKAVDNIDENHNVVEMATTNDSSDEENSLKKVSKKSRTIKKKPLKKDLELKSTETLDINKKSVKKYFPDSIVDDTSNSSSSKSLVVIATKPKPKRNTKAKESKVVEVKKEKLTKKTNYDDDDSDDDDDDDGWEEVKVDETEPDLDQIMATISREPIEIHIEGSKKKKKQFDIGQYMKRIYKSFQKKMSIEVHKTHLLSWLYHGLYLNEQANNEIALATALSICPEELYELQYSVFDRDVLTQLLQNLNESIKIENKSIENDYKVCTRSTCEAIGSLKAHNNLEYILVVLALMRCLKIRCRLCISFNVVSIKTDAKQLNSGKKRKEVDEGEEGEGSDSEKKTKKKSTARKRKSTSTKKKKTEETEESSEEEEEEEDVDEEARSIDVDNNKKAKKRSSLKRNCKASMVAHDDDASKKEKDTSTYFSEDEDFAPIKLRSAQKNTKSKSKNSPSTSAQVNEESMESTKDDELNLSSIKRNAKLKRTKPLVKNGMLISDDDDDDNEGDEYEHLNDDASEHLNYWIEVYVDADEIWVPVEPLKSKIDCANYLESRLSNPVIYVCAFDNDNKVKDVTKRYATAWNTHTRKLRIENFDTKFWWEKTLLKLKPIDLELDLSENRALESNWEFGWNV